MPLTPEQFEASPLMYAAPGRIAKLLCGHTLEEFSACAPAMMRLQQYAQEVCALPELPADWKSDKAIVRIVLADFDSLERVALWIGAFRYSEGMRCVIDGEKKEALARLLPGIYPKCLRGALDTKAWVSRCTGVDCHVIPDDDEVFRSYGWGVLTGALRRVAGVWERWLMRWEEELADEMQKCELPAGEILPDDDSLLMFLELK